MPYEDVFFAIRLRNGDYLKRVHSDGSSSSANNPIAALQFHSLEQAEGYVSQYLKRDASCLGIVKVTVTTEVVRESCIG